MNCSKSSVPTSFSLFAILHRSSFTDDIVGRGAFGTVRRIRRKSDGLVSVVTLLLCAPGSPINVCVLSLDTGSRSEGNFLHQNGDQGEEAACRRV